MRTLMIAGVAAAMVLAASSAGAQRIGPNGAGASYPAPGAHPMPMPPAPMPAPHPGGWNGGQMHGGWNGGQPQPMPTQPHPGGWNGQPRPMPQPMPNPPRPGGPGWNNGQWHGGGQWNGGQWHGGNWNGGNGYNGQWHGGGRWGGSIGGYWYAGVQAPGGWNGYKHLKRGKTLPRYWISDAFVIGDYDRYGLIAPPPGYYWTRYYNDAVLIDQYGVIYDSRDGLDWDRYDAGYNDGYGYDAGGYAAPAYPAPAPAPAYPAPAPVYPGPAYGTTYESSSSYGYESGGRVITAPGGPGAVSISTYPTPPGTATTIVIPGATMTTTTTTEYVEERYVAPKRVVRVIKHTWRPRPKPRCYCEAPIRGS